MINATSLVAFNVTASSQAAAESRTASNASDSAADSNSAFRPNDWFWLLPICGLALLLRWLHVFQTSQFPTVIQPIGDSKGYLDWADQIAAGDWYGKVSFYQAPLYPYFLAVLKAAGLGIQGIRLMQICLGTMGVALIGWCTARLFADRRAAFAAALLLATYPPAIYYDGLIQKAALASFLLCGFLCLLAELAHRPRLWLACLTGISLGLLVLTRENALLWIPIPALWVLLNFGRKAENDGTDQALSWRARWFGVAAYGAGILLILFPVSARNASLGGEWSPTTVQAGPNFYIGNNAEANGVYSPLVPGHETPLYERSDAVRLAEAETGQTLSPREVSDFWMGKAWSDISDDPGRWINLMFIKALMVINYYEVPDVEALTVYRGHSAPLMAFGPVWHFGLLMPLAIAGLIYVRGRWRDFWVMPVLLTTMVAAIVLFFILGRYRHPLVPLLIPFAAMGIMETVRLAREQQFRLLLAPLLSGFAVAIACHVPVHDRQTLDASSYMNVGISAVQSGNVNAGIRLMRQALEAQPGMPEAYFNLGRALMIAGNPGEAARNYDIALQIEPSLTQIYFHMAEALEQLGDYQTAYEYYGAAMRTNPSNEAADGRQRIESYLRERP